MQKYQIQNSIGNGNFSTVFKAQIMPSRQPCAIKIMRSHPKIALREAQLLRKFKHPNIITIIDFQQNQQESKLILEYIGINTLELYQKNTYGLREEQVKCILFQTVLGLSCVHSYGIIHRDVKPENILIDKKLAIVKLIDFGLAIDQRQVSTDYIATRWYRAPENLLGTKQYTCAIDVFSLGCVIVELYLGSPLFPGANNLDQIFKIFNILGYPTEQSWPKGYEKMIELGIKPVDFEKKKELSLKSILSQCDPKLVDIIEKMLQFNPKNRIKCSQILRHEYFREIKGIVPPGVWKKFQEDILENQIDKGLKAFQNVKSSKNRSIEGLRKGPQINFHNVGNKPKQNQDIQKMVEKTNFFRQKKSSSLDSYQLFKQDPRPLPNKIVIAQPSNHHQINRKLSTPSLNSNLGMEHSKLTATNFSFEGESIKTNKFINEGVRKFIKSKHVIQSIPQQEDRQLKGSTFVQDLSETAHSQISRNYNKNSMEFDSKNSKAFAAVDSGKTAYPLINNVPLVQEQPLEKTNFKIPNRIFSPPANMSYINQSFTSSQKRLQQHRSPINVSLKPFLNSNQHPQKTFVHSNSFQNLHENFSKSHHAKPQTNSRPNFLIAEQINLRSNFPSPNQNLTLRNMQLVSLRPQINYQSPNPISNRVYFSPPQRCVMENQMDLRLDVRQNRLVAIDKLKPIQQFLSPRHHNFGQN